MGSVPSLFEIFEAIVTLVVVPLIGAFVWAIIYLNKKHEEQEDKITALRLKIAEEYTPLGRHLDSEGKLTSAIEKLTEKIDAVLMRIGPRD